MTNVVDVSVVIPTRSRPDAVVRAARSALDQTSPPREVLVVVDGPDPATVTALEQIGDDRIQVISHPKSRGAGAARNTGVSAASGRYLAFLDDDDAWLPRKLERQLQLLEQAADPDRVLVGCQGRWEGDRTTTIWPTRAPRTDEQIAEYLFLRRTAGEGVLATPTLLLTTGLARSHPFPEHLATHEEWDWMLDLQRAGVRPLVVMEPLVRVDARMGRTSVSSGGKWRASLAWGLTRASDLGPKAFAAFVLNEVARAALGAHAGPVAYLAVGMVGLTGRVRLLDLARFGLRPLVLALRRARQR